MFVGGEVTLATAFGRTGIPFVERDQVAAEREAARNSHPVLRPFGPLSATLVGRRSHDETARRNRHHRRRIRRIPDRRVRTVGAGWRIVVVGAGEALSAAASLPRGVFRFALALPRAEIEVRFAGTYTHQFGGTGRRFGAGDARRPLGDLAAHGQQRDIEEGAGGSQRGQRAQVHQ